MNFLHEAGLTALVMMVLPVCAQAAPFLFLGASLLCLWGHGLLPLAVNALACVLLLRLSRHLSWGKRLRHLGVLLETAAMLLLRGKVPGLSYSALVLIGLLLDGERAGVAELSAAMYYPCQGMGPIVRAQELGERFKRPEALTWERFSRGMFRICLGLFKKTVLAMRLSPLVTDAFASPGEYGRGSLWLALLFYAVELYMDFSGAMDMVLGLSTLLGIDLPENFRRPYLSRGFADYWHRWHITMGAWFRRYVFYPLAKARPVMTCSARTLRLCRTRAGKRVVASLVPLLVTWALTGLWHGLAPHYLVWGLANGVLILLEAAFDQGRGRRAYWIPCVFFILLLVRVLFRAPSLPLAGAYYRGLLLGQGMSLSLQGTDLGIVLLGTGAIFAWEVLEEKGKAFSLSVPARLCLAAALIALTAVVGLYGPGYSAQEFYYGRF